MIYNNRKQILECCAVNIPWTAGIEKENLKDIAVMTGATLVDNEYGLQIEDVQLTDLGSAKNIKIDPEFTHVVGGDCTRESLDERCAQILQTIQQEESPNLKKIHQERYARMTAKIAEIQVGGGTDAERGEERDLLVDALNSAKSAMQYGVLPGGGVALYQAAKVLQGTGLDDFVEDKSELVGVRILAEAL